MLAQYESNTLADFSYTEKDAVFEKNNANWIATTQKKMPAMSTARIADLATRKKMLFLSIHVN